MSLAPRIDALENQVGRDTQISADHTASAGELLFIDTTGGPVNVTLPGSPNLGDRVIIVDEKYNFNEQPVTLLHNGNPINGVVDDLEIAIEGEKAILIWRGGSDGWRVY